MHLNVTQKMTTVNTPHCVNYCREERRYFSRVVRKE